MALIDYGLQGRQARSISKTLLWVFSVLWTWLWTSHWGGDDECTALSLLNHVKFFLSLFRYTYNPCYRATLRSLSNPISPLQLFPSQFAFLLHSAIFQDLLLTSFERQEKKHGRLGALFCCFGLEGSRLLWTTRVGDETNGLQPCFNLRIAIFISLSTISHCPTSGSKSLCSMDDSFHIVRNTNTMVAFPTKPDAQWNQVTRKQFSHQIRVSS